MPFFRRVLGMVWDSIAGRYVKALREVAVDEAGVKRDYTVRYSHEGTRITSGLPSLDVEPPEPKDPFLAMAEGDESYAAFLRGLYAPDPWTETAQRGQGLGGLYGWDEFQASQRKGKA